MDELMLAKYKAALLIAQIALEFYGKQVYTHKMELPVDVQFVAEDALQAIESLVGLYKEGISNAKSN